jgi:hypothetical protein
MQSEQVLIEAPSLSHAVSGASWKSRVFRVGLYAVLAITAMAVFIPLNPRMPGRGIDPSYSFAMNEAVARHMSFGKDIVFTYGPYAAVGTHSYDPATDSRMMGCSLLVAVSYLTAALYLVRGRRRYLILILLLFLATFGNGEILLLSYPWLLALCVVKAAEATETGEKALLHWRQTLAALVMWSALGLLPLVKGSLLVPFAASLAIPAARLLYCARFGQALLLMLTPTAAMLGFWLMADQSLGNFAAYLHGISLLTSGYTEAMSTPWSALPSIAGVGLVAAYLGLAALVFVSLGRANRLSVPSRLALGAVCALFLLVAFKHGFVIVMNVSGAFASVAIFVLILGFLYLDKKLVWTLAIATTLTATTSIIRDPVLVKEVHDRFGVGAAWTGGQNRGDILAFCLERAADAFTRTTYKTTWNTYADAWQGLATRLLQKGALEQRFAQSETNIRNYYSLPTLKGSADIYECDQSLLLASGNTWNPRPVLQGYSVYTPELARLDEEHLRGGQAPEWIWFDLQTIDARLPSLDDGMSWPALLDNYNFTSFDGRFVLLHNNQAARHASNYADMETSRHKAVETVSLPDTDGLLFAEVVMKPTLAGHVATELFNPPELRMTVGLENGETKSFRVVSKMMETEFLLSPLINDTGEFASLMNRDMRAKAGVRVRTISITPSYGGSLYWRREYELTVKRYVGR